MLNVSHPWKLLRSVTADDTLLDLTTSTKNKADWGDRPVSQLINIMDHAQGLGLFDLDQAIMEIAFLGSDTANDTATWTLYAWRDNGPCELVMDGTCTLGTLKAETDPTNQHAALTSWLYADTIAVSNNYASIPYEVVDSANNRIARLRLPVLGRMFWCLLFTDVVGAGQMETAKAMFSCYVSGSGIPSDPDIGTVTANAGTNLNTSALALEAGGNLATVKTNTAPLVTAGGGGYVRQDSTATMAKEAGGNLATVKTNTDPLVTAGGGGYVRQDSTATLAKESSGNLAAIKALLNLTPVAEAAVQLAVTVANQTAVVVAGTTASYVLTAVDGIIYAGFNGTVVTVTNRAWTIPPGQSRLITMPAALTTLNYSGDAACTGYLQKVANS